MRSSWRTGRVRSRSCGCATPTPTPTHPTHTLSAWRLNELVAGHRCLWLPCHLPQQYKVFNDSKEKGYMLPFATSPLPRDRPVRRRVNATFMIQYWKQPKSIEARGPAFSGGIARFPLASPRCLPALLSSTVAVSICTRGDAAASAAAAVVSLQMVTKELWQCTHGNLGTGKLKGVTSELLVNVDSRVRWAPSLAPSRRLRCLTLPTRALGAPVDCSYVPCFQDVSTLPLGTDDYAHLLPLERAQGDGAPWDDAVKKYERGAPPQRVQTHNHHTRPQTLGPSSPPLG